MSIFKSCGVMLDMSRDGVMTVESIKEYVTLISKMGFDTLYLYMEDVYELEGYPMFGYMRGGYSHEELREIDSFCVENNMKMIPCIQTLGHMEQYLKYTEARPVRDTSRELLCGAEETYKLIEAMIKTMRECISGDKLHIGMDEALELGTGQYFLLHGYEDKKEIFLKHLKRVCDICEKYGFTPMIWDDVAISLVMNGDKEDANNILPEKLELVPWSYGCCAVKCVADRVGMIKGVDRPITFAGSTWTHGAPLPRYKICKAANVISAVGAHECGVENYMITNWGDNGCQCDYWFAMPSVMELGFYNLYGKMPTDEELCELAEKHGIIDYRFCDIAAKLDQPKGYDIDLGKRLVWGDLLYNNTRVFDKEYGAILAKAAEDIKPFIAKNDKWKIYYDYAWHYMKVAAIKAEIVTNLQEEYFKGNREYLIDVCEKKLPEIKELLLELEQIHRQIWLKTYKPFGYQKNCSRYGAQIMRISYTHDRIRDYLDGEIANIPELDAKRIPYLEEDNKSFLTEEGGTYIDYEKWLGVGFSDISI